MLSLLMADSGSEDDFPPSDDVNKSDTHGDFPSSSGRGKGGGGKRPRFSIEDDDWFFPGNREDYQPSLKPFEEPTGYRGEKDLTNAKPVDFLYLFLTEDFWKLITEETNRYSREFFDREEEELKPSSRFHQWSDVSVSDMKAFLSLLFCMGLVEKAEIEDYWASFWPTYTPGFAKIMSRNRFELIMSFLHFADNSKYVKRGQPNHDCLFKVRPIIDLIVPRFAAVYSPHKELSLNEMTIALKGRSGMDEYDSQINRFTYKAYVLSESKTGYVLQWSLYTGEKTHDGNDVGDANRIFHYLLGPYAGKGHEVYMDSDQTSLTLANEVAQSDAGVWGTVSTTSEGMSSGLSPEEDPVFPRNSHLLACAWPDTKLVTMFSSVDGNPCVSKGIRTKKTKSGYHIIYRPVCLDMYNRFMGGVDRSDHRAKTYILPHRSKKWYNRVFNAILSISVVNAHVLYTQCTPRPHKSLKAFIQDLIPDLLQGYTKKESKQGGRPPAERGELPQRLTERHWLYETSERPDCAVCSNRNRPGGRRQTHYRCGQCGVGLCAVPCNEVYHTQKKYKRCHLDK